MRPVCPKCNLTIERGEEFHPVVKPFHVPCREHKQCYVLCIDSHPEYVKWYEGQFGRTPIQRSAA